MQCNACKTTDIFSGVLSPKTFAFKCVCVCVSVSV